jgi:pimeloyl-ACP methyl ester carboxylesterase
MLMAAHRSRHHLLTDFLDPSVLNEHDRRRDPQLNLYSPDNPNQPPYSTDFLASYRQAQIARNRRITARVKQELEDLRRNGNDDAEHCFVVHGTMADPRWLDPTAEPNGRTPRWSYLGDPALANDGPAGLARFSTLRSWLSQWSLDDAQVDAVDAAPRISVPILITVNGRDDACPTSHTNAVCEAIAHENKERHELVDANHYFSGTEQRTHLQQAADIVSSWLDSKGFR